MTGQRAIRSAARFNGRSDILRIAQMPGDRRLFADASTVLRPDACPGPADIMPHVVG
jgi:hypothetical protein